MSEPARGTSDTKTLPGCGPVPAQPLLRWAEKTLVPAGAATSPALADREMSSRRFGRLRGRRKP